MVAGRRVIAGVGVVALALGVVAVPAGAHAAPTTAAARAGAYTVTLVTGDRVDLVEYPDGKVTTSIRTGPGRDRLTFLTTGRGDDLTVLPSDAVGPVTSGLVDRRLFQVLRLAHDGYDDRHRPSLPLIVASRTGARALASIGADAVDQPKNSANAFWPGVVSGRTGVTKVWLDAKSTVLDDQSNTQIGVPAARTRGLTGAGVPVAVLDTGYDASHPDLAATVTGSRDFTDNPAGVKDGHGHGTHVASILAGSGAGNPQYTGVAPGARLLVGKVCDNGGRCSDSAAIAGMEWAVAQGARVVSMSFGGGPTDGTDPLALAVNRLTASSGTLFVAAAGNTVGWRQVGSPAAADAALAVGSVGRTDKPSTFSSAGPRVGDEAVKPDITAPGEGIVAARAAGTSMGTPVDTRYTAASGTSMSTPHVAGAAALLAQQHPDWKADRLKAALMSTAAPAPGVDVFTQGAGRVDVDRATAQTVYATSGSVSFGTLGWADRGKPPVSRNVVYRNDGADPVPVTLALAGTGPAGLLTAGATTLTVPAHGEAAVPVVLTPGAATTAGIVSARLTATAPGGVAVQTAVGVTVAEEKYTLTLNLIGRDGRPAPDALGQSVIVASEAGGSQSVKVAGGTARVALPKGRYAVTALVQTGTKDRNDATLVHVPMAALDSDRTVTVDARPGRRVSVRTDRADAVLKSWSLDVLLATAHGFPTMFSSAGTDLYAVPVRVPAGQVTFGLHAELGPPTGSGYAYRLARAMPDEIPATLDWRVRDSDLGEVRTRYRAQGIPALASRASSPFYLPGQSLAWGGYFTVPLPSRTVEYFSPGPVQWTNSMIQRPAGRPQPTDGDGMIADNGTTYEAGRPVSQEWNRAVFGPELQLWKVGSNLVGRWGDDIVASTYLFAPNEPGHTSYPYSGLPYVSGTTTLSRDGKVLASSETPGVLYAQGLPADEGRYTLSTTARRSPAWSALSPRVDTAWTFTSKHVDGSGLEFLPLLTVRATTDLDDLNRAPQTEWAVIDLRAETQKGAKAVAPVRDVTLELSTDDGRTWKSTPVFGSCAERRALVFHPRARTGTGYVSLRMTATDAAGGRVEQTVIRAYGLR